MSENQRIFRFGSFGSKELVPAEIRNGRMHTILPFSFAHRIFAIDLHVFVL